MDELIDDEKDAIVRLFQTWRNGELPLVTSHEQDHEEGRESGDEWHELTVTGLTTFQMEERAEVWMSRILEVLERDDVEQVFVAVGMSHLAEVPDDIEFEHIRSRLAGDFDEERVH